MQSQRYDAPSMGDGYNWNFKELHLFPRTLFVIGVALFVGSIVGEKRIHCVLLGLGLIFFAVGFNILYDLARSPAERAFEVRPTETPENAAVRRANEQKQQRIERRFLRTESVVGILVGLVMAICNTIWLLGCRL